MSSEDMESMDATLELLTDPDALCRIERARRDLEDGLGTTAAHMAELMAQRHAPDNR
jgi:antitoxin YefM